MDIENIIADNQIPRETSRADQTVLGKDDFLRLMMVQMQNQDPLDPMDNEAMLSQMAQFSSLEQMSNLNTTMAQANANATFMDATRLLGRRVVLANPSIEEGQSSIISSPVKSVSHGSQGPVLSLENGFVVSVDEIIQVEDAAE